MLAVGDSTRLEIIFSTKKYKNRMSKRPRIQTNEGPPDKSVTIETVVVQRPDSTYPVIIEPYKVDLSQFTEKTVDSKEFEIRNVSDQDLRLTLVYQPTDMMAVELPQSIEAGKSAKGRVQLIGDALSDSFEKSFTFEMDDENKTRFTVPVKRTMRKPAPGISKIKAGKGKDSGSEK